MRAYIKYDQQGRIVTGSLVIVNSKPKIGDWVEVDMVKTTVANPLPVTKYIRAIIRYDAKNKIVPGSLIITRSIPSIGKWLEVPMKKLPSTTTII